MYLYFASSFSIIFPRFYSCIIFILIFLELISRWQSGSDADNTNISQRRKIPCGTCVEQPTLRELFEIFEFSGVELTTIRV